MEGLLHMGPQAVIFSEMSPQSSWENDFNDWYNTEHIPARLKIPGFIRAQRYLSTSQDRRYMVIYELSGMDVLKQDAYKLLRESPSERTKWMLENVSGFTRYVGELLSISTRPDVPRYWESPFVYSVLFNVPEDSEAEFNAWYELDHVPTLLKEINWLACLRYKIHVSEGGNFTHLAVHYLADAKALESRYREIARSSPWRYRLSKQSWFKGAYHLYRKLPMYK